MTIVRTFPFAHNGSVALHEDDDGHFWVSPFDSASPPPASLAGAEHFRGPYTSLEEAVAAAEQLCRELSGG